MKVIEVIHRNSGLRVSIEPDLVTAHKSVGTIALGKDIYQFRSADLNVIWLFWKSGLDFDDCDELLGVFFDLNRAQELLNEFGDFGSHQYYITCEEIGDEVSIKRALEAESARRAKT